MNGTNWCQSAILTWAGRPAHQGEEEVQLDTEVPHQQPSTKHCRLCIQHEAQCSRQLHTFKLPSIQQNSLSTARAPTWTPSCLAGKENQQGAILTSLLSEYQCANAQTLCHSIYNTIIWGVIRTSIKTQSTVCRTAHICTAHPSPATPV